jgi:hypothetical protein
MIDVTINIDSLYLDCDEGVEDVIDWLRNMYEFGYEPTYEVLHEEIIDD